MFGTWWCPYCSHAREYLVSNNISYCEYDIEKSEIGKDLFEATGAVGIPALKIGDYLIDGFNPDAINKALSLSKQENYNDSL